MSTHPLRSLADTRRRLTIAVDFEDHGVGKQLAPLVAAVAGVRHDREVHWEAEDEERRLHSAGVAPGQEPARATLGQTTAANVHHAPLRT